MFVDHLYMWEKNNSYMSHSNWYNEKISRGPRCANHTAQYANEYQLWIIIPLMRKSHLAHDHAHSKTMTTIKKEKQRVRKKR